jgi:hypothetical protein
MGTATREEKHPYRVSGLVQQLIRQRISALGRIRLLPYIRTVRIMA